LRQIIKETVAKWEHNRPVAVTAIKMRRLVDAATQAGK
jgi:hypothetical protein